MAITIKNEREIAKMAEAGHVVGVCHQRIQRAIAPGVTTGELDAIVVDTVTEFGAVASFLGYGGFPGSICASVNEEVVHGIPGKRRLREGDIIAVDIGAIVDGWHGDSAWTYPVGTVSDEAATLLLDTEAALYAGIDQARAGNRLGAIGHAIETVIIERGKGKYGNVREWGGHGIGRSMHEDPHVSNFGDPNSGMRLRPGMVIAIEPMVNLGGDEVKVLKDQWTVVTKDGGISAHFEHTVAITADDPIILTKRLPAVVD
ncbi:MAG: type I methionyl aminopeptidase [Thermomicrobiales bacterium]